MQFPPRPLASCPRDILLARRKRFFAGAFAAQMPPYVSGHTTIPTAANSAVSAHRQIRLFLKPRSDPGCHSFFDHRTPIAAHLARLKTSSERHFWPTRPTFATETPNRFVVARVISPDLNAAAILLRKSIGREPAVSAGILVQ
jgi:hypothetical protein